MDIQCREIFDFDFNRCNPYYNGKDIQLFLVGVLLHCCCNPYYNGKDIQYCFT